MITALFVLMQFTTAPTPTPAARTPTAAAEKKVCRRISETGSLVRQVKSCRTASEWRRLEQNARETGREMQGQLSGERGGG